MSKIRMPAMFIGHGSPMNAIEENDYTRAWAALGNSIPRPTAILAISAHWYTRGTGVTAMAFPRTIHDFGNFPQPLFDVQYPALGSPQLARRVAELVAPIEVIQDHQWGLDHGTWGILVKMFPEADIPVVQLSIDATQSPEWHYQLGQKLSALRDEGVLIFASGNTVHNLGEMTRAPNVAPFAWAREFDDYVKRSLASPLGQAHHPLVDFMQQPLARRAHPTPEHFLPLLYVMGTAYEDEQVQVPIEGIEMGSLSMMSIVIG